MLISGIASNRRYLYDSDEECFRQLYKVLFSFMDRQIFDQYLINSLDRASKHGHSYAFSLTERPVDLKVYRDKAK